MKKYVYMADYDESHKIYRHYTRRNNVNYNGQKSMAKKRKIEWKFTFYTWLEWWVNTGHFDERGVTNKNYQMCRYNDTGEYSPENVYCDTGKNNKLECDKLKIPFMFNDIQYGSVSDAIRASGVSRGTFYTKYRY